MFFFGKKQHIFWRKILEFSSKKQDFGVADSIGQGSRGSAPPQPAGGEWTETPALVASVVDRSFRARQGRRLQTLGIGIPTLTADRFPPTRRVASRGSETIVIWITSRSGLRRREAGGRTSHLCLMEGQDARWGLGCSSVL